jgi:cytochrome c biogenesis protein CcdA
MLFLKTFSILFIIVGAALIVIGQFEKNRSGKWAAAFRGLALAAFGAAMFWWARQMG